MRSAEALGYQSVHVIESADRFKRSARTAQGADKWLDVVRWPSPAPCVAHLHEAGYQIVVTDLEASRTLGEVDFTQKTAVVFGNEAAGISPEMASLADARCVIPMAGFVESFNISVAAAVVLYHAFRYRVDRLGAHGDLDEQELNLLRARWYMKSVKEPEAIIFRSSRS
jgi:tRNA (guanosine-2'-O-)-methyltransferase